MCRRVQRKVWVALTNAASLKPAKTHTCWSQAKTTTKTTGQKNNRKVLFPGQVEFPPRSQLALGVLAFWGVNTHRCPDWNRRNFWNRRKFLKPPKNFETAKIFAEFFWNRRKFLKPPKILKPLKFGFSNLPIAPLTASKPYRKPPFRAERRCWRPGPDGSAINCPDQCRALLIWSGLGAVVVVVVVATCVRACVWSGRNVVCVCARAHTQNFHFLKTHFACARALTHTTFLPLHTHTRTLLL